jgi:hypothetical protein
MALSTKRILFPSVDRDGSVSKALQLDPTSSIPARTLLFEETSSRRQLVAASCYLAKTCAAAGRNQEAITHLCKALEAGFRDQKKLMTDKEFAVLRSTAEFRQLMPEQHGSKKSAA